MKGALATTRGWINPRTGELLKCQKMTQEQADKLNGIVISEEPQPKKQTLHEAPVIEEKVITEEEEDFYYGEEDDLEEE